MHRIFEENPWDKLAVFRLLRNHRERTKTTIGGGKVDALGNCREADGGGEKGKIEEGITQPPRVTRGQTVSTLAWVERESA